MHPNEKARRRDPRIYNYQPVPCPDDRKVRVVSFYVTRVSVYGDSAWLVTVGEAASGYQSDSMFLLLLPAGSELPKKGQLPIHGIDPQASSNKVAS